MNLLIVDGEPAARERLVERLPAPSGLVRLAAQPVGEREDRIYLLDPQKIDYIESDGNYVRYRVANGEYIARETGKHLDALLHPVGFLRIERSLLVNIRAIAYAEPMGNRTFVFTLTSGARLRSGPAYRESILSVLLLKRRASTLAVKAARGAKREPLPPPR